MMKYTLHNLSIRNDMDLGLSNWRCCFLILINLCRNVFHVGEIVLEYCLYWYTCICKHSSTRLKYSTVLMALNLSFYLAIEGDSGKGTWHSKVVKKVRKIGNPTNHPIPQYQAQGMIIVYVIIFRVYRYTDPNRRTVIFSEFIFISVRPRNAEIRKHVNYGCLHRVYEALKFNKKAIKFFIIDNFNCCDTSVL